MVDEGGSEVTKKRSSKSLAVWAAIYLAGVVAAVVVAVTVVVSAGAIFTVALKGPADASSVSLWGWSVMISAAILGFWFEFGRRLWGGK